MLIKSTQRFEPAAVGTTVMVPVTDVDRGRCEFRNIKAVVLECMSNGLYKLGTKHGVLKQAYSRNQFTPVKESFLELAEVPKDKEVSVREVAREDSLGTGEEPRGLREAGKIGRKVGH